MNRQKREPSNPLPTPCQRGTNILPTGCVFQPPITPWRWNRPTQRWNAAGPFDRLKGSTKVREQQEDQHKDQHNANEADRRQRAHVSVVTHVQGPGTPKPAGELCRAIRAARAANSPTLRQISPPAPSSRGWAASAVAIACIQASQSEPVRDAGLPSDDDTRLLTARKGPEVNRGLDLGHRCQHTSAPNILVVQVVGGGELPVPPGEPDEPLLAGACPVGPQRGSAPQGDGGGVGVVTVAGGQPLTRPKISTAHCALAGDAANSASPTRRR
jgi:hypothetical protein